MLFGSSVIARRSQITVSSVTKIRQRVLLVEIHHGRQSADDRRSPRPFGRDHEASAASLVPTTQRRLGIGATAGILQASTVARVGEASMSPFGPNRPSRISCRMSAFWGEAAITIVRPLGS
jgi:hypothetical protein